MAAEPIPTIDDVTKRGVYAVRESRKRFAEAERSIVGMWAGSGPVGVTPKLRWEAKHRGLGSYEGH